MTKTEVIEALAAEAGCGRKQARALLKSLATVVEREVGKGEVPIAGIGRFRVVTRQSRTSRHPGAGHKVRVRTSRVMRFTVAPRLKDAVEKGKRSRAKK